MIDPRRPGPSRPPVRLRPAPAYEPPFVDEGSGWPRPSDGQLALDLFAARQWPARSESERPPGQRVAARPVPVRPGRDPARQLPPGALATATPAATRVAHRFVANCIEVFNGFRPPVQLRRQLDPARHAQLLPELARATARAVPARRRTPRPGLRLRRLRVCELHPTAIEAAAVLTGIVDTSWAMALRLEHRRGTWLCTDLRVL
ncbi:Rv3235 family protein [Micromonospora sp. NPDC051196]|uniref:Rv3235 family protein n=1 Tax=Micromonospora sp. NPDC051196 TaxID=3155281 RepID=UPI00342E2D1C